MIVLNYGEHSKEILENGFVKFPNTRDMLIVAKHLSENGYKNDEISAKLLSLCEKIDKNFKMNIWEKKNKIVLKKIKKPLKELKTEIFFSKNEMDSIKSAGSYELQKIFFVMMAICKTYDTDKIYLNSQSPFKLKDILSLARVNWSTTKAENALHDFYTQGLVKVSPNLEYRIACIENCAPCDSALTVYPCVNMVENFDIYTKKAVHCARCGAYTRKNSNNTKYCPACAKEIKREKDLLRMREISKVEK